MVCQILFSFLIDQSAVLYIVILSITDQDRSHEAHCFFSYFSSMSHEMVWDESGSRSCCSKLGAMRCLALMLSIACWKTIVDCETCCATCKQWAGGSHLWEKRGYLVLLLCRIARSVTRCDDVIFRWHEKIQNRKIRSCFAAFVNYFINFLL